MEDPKKQHPRLTWVAIALSLVATGVGHIDCGQIVKGILLFSAWFLIAPLVLVATVVPPTTSTLIWLFVAPALFLLALHTFAAIDAYRVARRVGSEYQLHDYNRLAIYVTLIVVALVYRIGLTASLRETSFEVFMISTSSMSPTVIAGDQVLVNKTLGRQSLPEHGDLIAFRTPEAHGATYVKRVVGLPGDRVSMDAGIPIINGRSLHHEPISSAGITMDEPDSDVYLEQHGTRQYRIQMMDLNSLDEAHRERRQMTEFVVPPRSVFVLGDNRDLSKDSRSFGVVPAGDIVGVLQYIHWPSRAWSRFGAIR